MLAKRILYSETEEHVKAKSFGKQNYILRSRTKYINYHIKLSGCTERDDYNIYNRIPDWFFCKFYCF